MNGNRIASPPVGIKIRLVILSEGVRAGGPPAATERDREAQHQRGQIVDAV
jgi:hypothetical protein